MKKLQEFSELVRHGERISMEKSKIGTERERAKASKNAHK